MTHKGPWLIVGELEDAYIAIQDADGNLVCELTPYVDEWTPEELANIQLIAAAPELLESLMEMREACAACFRVIATQEGLVDAAEREFTSARLREGFGVRAQDAIAKASEGKLP